MKVKTVVTRIKYGILIEVWDTKDSPNLTSLVDRKVYLWDELINMMRGDM